METNIWDAVKQSALKMEVSGLDWLDNCTLPSFDFEESGKDGTRIILLHGLFGAASNWDGVFPLFKESYRPLALKFPIATGERAEVEVKALALMLEAFLRTTANEKVVLCGNSMGGHVALRLVLNAPDLVSGMILSGTSGLYEHTVDSLPVRPGADFVRDHMSRVFYNQSFVTDEAVAEIADILTSRKKTLNIINAARSAKRDNLYEELPKIKVPTLLLWGEEDKITTLDVGKVFEERIPNSKLITKVQCGHAPMIEHPQWFYQECKAFLDTL